MSEPWRRLPALSLKQIQYFVTLAQLRHFTDTANRLAISQPALSSALRQVESVLGGKLMNRTASAVTLTELGTAILPHAERVLNVAQAAFDDMQRIVLAGGDGTLRVGLVPSVGSLLFPAVPQLLAEHFPRLRIEFHDQTNDSLLLQLENGQIDFGIGALDSSVPDSLEIHPLQEDPFVVVMRRDDPLAESHHLPWRQLSRRNIAVFSKGNISRLVLALAESHRLNLTAAYQVDFLETLYGLVRSNLAVAILPQLYTVHLQDEELTVVHLQQPLLSRTIALMRSAHQSRPPLIENCFQLLLQEFQKRMKP
ncbi:Morphology and auto-aggregation control protein [Serratia entomophila]|jgi:LysR family carnitine catabolism transcriptional activator|uniref:LysR family transcriptional regulator n=1 Tax=Serratia entomophila TaxID=42906 RepID=UPI001F18A5AB|nr:LysR family transcriptional regulator [Serratia entomophila]UIW19395.1 LysR family transcriptional regulator [Serratia entomophila]CAI0785693.1 Morphology and auto-aggregation control protein [Serratia entomophila]CAI0807345.1 Morphology and auto-aggregation control protein [Serratia entomophila]CAI0808016.1 Morphology and auto-aggregation control protein [Serratia entomophila]CAI0809891.1 Morphology and auto-aggregation control protein [Serratia entomophila]